MSDAWPSLIATNGPATRDTLHLWTQVVGKIRMVHTPLINHWWNIPLYVTARGFTTSLIPYDRERSFQIDFDFDAHELDIVVSNGDARTVPLGPRSVADFYAEVMKRLDELDLTTPIWTMPVEIPGAIAFDQDREHSAYDREYVRKLWRAFASADRVFTEFRARFVGKASPVHLFWGALDLAVTRFSGRPAPPHPGGAPNCGPFVMLEAYSHEVSSCGYWPGGDGEGLFYSYAYPEPAGFRDALAGPAGAGYNDEMGEFVLPYEVVREAADPDSVLLEFLQRTYEAAADAADWDRARLERAI